MIQVMGTHGVLNICLGEEGPLLCQVLREEALSPGQGWIPATDGVLPQFGATITYKGWGAGKQIETEQQSSHGQMWLQFLSLCTSLLGAWITGWKMRMILTILATIIISLLSQTTFFTTSSPFPFPLCFPPLLSFLVFCLFACFSFSHYF